MEHFFFRIKLLKFDIFSGYSGFPHTNKHKLKNMLWCALHCQTQLSGAITVNGVTALDHAEKERVKERDFVSSLIAGTA